MHHKNEIALIINNLVAGQGLDTCNDIRKIHELMDDYANDQAIKALTFCYTKFPTGKNLGEIIKDWKNRES